MKQNFEPKKKKAKFEEEDEKPRKQDKKQKPKRKGHDVPLYDSLGCNWDS